MYMNSVISSVSLKLVKRGNLNLPPKRPYHSISEVDTGMFLFWPAKT